MTLLSFLITEPALFLSRSVCATFMTLSFKGVSAFRCVAALLEVFGAGDKLTLGGSLGGKTLAAVVLFLEGIELRLFLSMMLWALEPTAIGLTCGREFFASVALLRPTNDVTGGKPSPILGSRCC